jgi:predicted TIM-barrel fold metal-dependent hydrolase
VYNDWLAEFCSYAPKRLYGIGLISLEDVDKGVEELERVAKQGLRGAMIWGSPPDDKPYSSPIYDKFWQAASDLSLPLSLHVITGKGKESRVSFRHMSTAYMNLIHEIQRTLTNLVMGGVLERFPRLKIVSAENDIGWFPHYMYRMDHAYDKFNAMEKNPLPMKPSEYVRRQIWGTFQDDAVGPATYQIFGENNYMWASDFPHTDSTWPDSRQWITKNFTGVPENVTHKIVFDNAVKLYRMDLQ